MLRLARPVRRSRRLLLPLLRRETSPSAFATARPHLVPRTMSSSPAVTFLNQADAVQVDVELMGSYGFSIDQLMELAGLSCACAVAKSCPVETHRRVAVVCGPGNNGGDGLVAARHLHHFGYECLVVYPKRSKKQLFVNLVTQVEALGMSVVEEVPDDVGALHVVLDGIFGFSFSGSIRSPFDAVVHRIKKAKQANADLKIVSIDIPSGWDVEKGNVSGDGLDPDVLVSLTAPKLCAKTFSGTHFLGGRFVPPGLAAKFNIVLPEYPGVEQVVLLASL